MSALVGGLLGLTTAGGLLLVWQVVAARRRTSLQVRVLPYLQDLSRTRELYTPVRPTGALGAVFGPLLPALARTIDSVLGGSDSIRRRLRRAGLDLTVHDFRVRQARWGLIAFTSVAVPCGLIALASPQRAIPLFLCAAVAGVLGVLLCENHLSAQVRARERAVLEEFPTIAELLALSVAAGESPVAALTRVTQRSRGALSADLQRLLGSVRTGTPLATAFDELAANSGLPVVTRFAEGMAVAIERGTPLADVLHAQAGDVREASRRQLIETGARKEVAMMVPVVFLVMPTVIVFAFFPGLIGLRMVV